MNWRRALLILALLMPGLGVILLMIGSVFYVAVMQSFGFYNLVGEDSFSLEHWQKVLNSKQFGRALPYSAYIAVIAASRLCHSGLSDRHLAAAAVSRHRW